MVQMSVFGEKLFRPSSVRVRLRTRPLCFSDRSENFVRIKPSQDALSLSVNYQTADEDMDLVKHRADMSAKP